MAMKAPELMASWYRERIGNPPTGDEVKTFLLGGGDVVSFVVPITSGGDPLVEGLVTLRWVLLD